MKTNIKVREYLALGVGANRWVGVGLINAIVHTGLTDWSNTGPITISHEMGWRGRGWGGVGASANSKRL